jgi:dephospho-CoA kinase
MKKVIFGLTGEMASGKGTVAQYLTKKYGGNSHRFSTILRDLTKRLYLEESRENLQKISKSLRKDFGEDLFSKIIFQDVKKDRYPIIVIDGVRRLADIKYLNTLPHFYLIYIEAELEKRFLRTRLRQENSDDAAKTLSEFKKEQLQEAELQIKSLKAKADFVIDNNGSREDLYFQIDQIVKANQE